MSDLDEELSRAEEAAGLCRSPSIFFPPRQRIDLYLRCEPLPLQRHPLEETASQAALMIQRERAVKALGPPGLGEYYPSTTFTFDGLFSGVS